MEKTIEISGKQVTFKSSGAIPKRYKMQFQRDFFKDLIGMGLSSMNLKDASEDEQLKAIRNLDFDLFYDIAWTLAKTADSSIPDPLTWLDSFDTFPIIDILPEIQDMLAASISSKKK